ncbi:DUF397 domain-containing protein [Streptomyces himalayensis]|uniref:DUF397 domain-containing protein n=1 Tax=Streptomyces himalayensis subsp. himalayensis TaxID=2756131 RepID=A0A7W0DRZ1_9ACTN|nr:DUF397 domain-containing protein [Streptomyces himalayensis]MBA2949725.1 DUF397 domain-containing protein [Streptomyces himalayensis subsp. himalayensis]
MTSAESAFEKSLSWFKSSYSNGAGGECVECAHTVDGTLIRDSKQAAGPVVAVRAPAWRAFLQGLGQECPVVDRAAA